MKKVIFDFFKNMMAYAMPVAVLQFLVQPYIASKLGVEKNGLFLTLIAVNYFLTSMTADILCKTRLLQNERYQQRSCVGDFNLLLVIMTAINTLVMVAAVSYYMGSGFTWLDAVLCSVVGLLFLIHDYIVAQYRVELNYSRILVSNLVLCVGYVLGTLCFATVFPHWQIIFIIAYGVCEVYDLSHTTYWKEPVCRTELFSETTRRYLLLVGAGLLTNLVSYGDRVLLYPVSDGATVSVFTAASSMGKMILLLATPMSSFLLGYVVKEEKLDIRLPIKRYLQGAGILVVLYAGCVAVSVPFLYYLYPDWADLSMKYVPITTLTSIFKFVAILVNVLVIRFCKSQWQIVINAVYLVTYVVLSFTLLHFFGLLGFCIGNALADAVRLLVSFWILRNKAI